MLIKVRLFANLRDFVPASKGGATLEVELPEGARIRDLVDHFKLPLDLVKLSYVNGIYQELDYQLHANDEIGIFPPIGGGQN
jgi:sulfur-carrier protein